MRQLASPTGAFDHRCLCRTPVHYERPAQRRRRVGRRQANQVRVFVEPLLMTRGIGAGRRRTLSDDHNKARANHRNQRLGSNQFGFSCVREPKAAA